MYDIDNLRKWFFFLYLLSTMLSVHDKPPEQLPVVKTGAYNSLTHSLGAI